MREKLQRFMIGRYGVDSFNRFLLGVSFVLILIATFIRYPYIDLLGLAVLGYAYFRMLSRNIQKRYGENAAFMKMTAGIRRFFHNKKTHVTQYKTHKFFRCPTCHQDIRVPRGKGQIRITCPKCRAEFERRT
ncbi:MAG: hypothetical protein Q4G60_01680 [bacterium]|nr:hypothetical protein [bacterium]